MANNENDCVDQGRKVVETSSDGSGQVCVPSVYRMKFVPDIKKDAKSLDRSSKDYKEAREKLFEDFFAKGYIGTGWADLKLKKDMSFEKVRDELFEKDNKKRKEANLSTVAEIRDLPPKEKQSLDVRSRMLAQLCGVEKGDYVWMTHGSHMQLFRVSENMVGRASELDFYSKDEDYYKRMDIGQILKGEWIEDIRTSKAPGVVLNQMGVGPTFMKVKKGARLTDDCWKAENDPSFAPAPITKAGFWELITNRQFEGLFLLYLQYEHELLVATETVKHSEKDFECVMMNKDGKRYYPQAKTGCPKDQDDCIESLIGKAKKRDGEFGAVLVAFAEYDTNYEVSLGESIEGKDVVLFSKDVLLDFAIAHKQLLAENLRAAVKLVEEP